MAERHSSKKTDKIEVRLAPETKQAFHETCEQQGESASSVIRRLIEEYVQRFHRPVIARPIEAIRRTPRWTRWGMAAGLAAMVAGLATLPSRAEPSRLERFFARIDTDGDRQFGLDDFLQALWMEDTDESGVGRDALVRFFADIDADGDGIVAWQEFYDGRLAENTRLFHQLDADGDGHVSFQEFTSPASVGVRGAISGMASGTAFRQGATPAEFDAEAGVLWMIGRTDAPPSATAVRLGQVFRDFDADDDGAVTLQEFLAH